ncbi:SRPBCC family protein [Pelagibacterium nitratireducens]|uniref:SRPBCC family protein n=1 Tax=Pelagibacterium nitratireducens TaxID=1046114 RepID=A0ABZ2I0G5_9HYPH
MSRYPNKGRTVVLTMLVAALAANLALEGIATRQRRGASDAAPGRTARRRRFGNYAVTGKTVTINRPRADLYAFWRDFSNLALFMENVETVESLGDGTFRWFIRAPLGQTIELDTQIIEERENALIAWRSVDTAAIRAEGKVEFREASDGRGTEIEAIIAYEPPAGELGRLIGMLFGREPAVQGRRELKRFKMLMETGEVADARYFASQN